MKQLYLLAVILFAGFFTKIEAQVSLTATSGTLAATYTTLKQAFDSINVGRHRGDIVIELTASTTEGTTPATLLSGDADPTNYTSIYIYPAADGISVSGNPGAGFGVIQLNGADNVIIDGDNPNTSGINRNLTINNTSATSAGYTSCLRVATLAGASAFADNIFLFNCNFNGNVTGGNASGITAATSSSNTSFGLYFGGKGAAATPTAITSETADAALAGTTINNVVIDNVSINQCARGIVFNGAATTVSSSLSITNSIIGASGAISGYPVTTPASTVYAKGIWVAGCDAVLVNGNTIQNILSYVGTTLAGVEMASNIGANLTITGNTINGVLNNGTGGTAAGVLVSSVANRFTVGSNVISNVQASLATSASPTTGITIATTGGAADVTKNRISGIYNRNTGGFGAVGVHFSTAANAGEITNNFIYDILNIGNFSFTTTTENATGILISNGSSHKIYHNSVHLSGASAATATNVISCFSVGSSAVASLDIRNNIFSNTVTLSGSPTNNAHVCMYFPFTSGAATSYTINNNAYYTGSIAGVSGVAFAGASSYAAANLFDVANFNPLATTPAANFRSWSSAAGNSGNDVASFGSTAAAPFVSGTDLHIVAGVTQLESGGTATSVADDIDGTGRGTFPDIGADEFVGTIQDLTPPSITYTPLTGTCVLGNRTLTANIVDPSGVPTAGAGRPVLYWRINAGAYAAVTGTSLGGGNYSFTFGAGAIVGDVVSYYIVAQDNAGTPNIVASPSTGAAGYTANPPAAGTPPTAPSSYAVQSNLAPGTYTVGGAGVYTTLTAAINAYNNSCLTGAIIFELIDATYSTSETFPIVIGNPVASATNTLTIRPAAGVNAIITGSSTGSLITFNGADYVTIDGSNNGTASQNLTITNTLSSTTTAVIWVASASAANGATNNTIKNCIITGSGTTSTYGGVVSSSGTTLGAVPPVANSNNTYENLTVHSVNRGIALVGVSTGDNNNTITQCRTGSTVVAEKIGYRGIFVFNQNNVTVINNTVLGILSTFGSNSDVAAGISVRGAITNGIVANNTISDCKNTSTAGWTVHGITLQSTGLNTGLSVYNNFIYDIAGDGFDNPVSDNGHGIGILSGGGYKVYYNSVNLTTNQISSGGTAALFIDNRPTGFSSTGPTPVNLDIRNNIFANSQTTFVRYSVYSLVPASSFTNINYNDYYTTGTTLGFLGGARANLAAWQAATGADANSVSAIPQFTSSTNLHLLGSSTLNNLGTPIAGIVTDIDAQIRSATTPDIGADEFTPPNCNGIITGGTITASKTTLCVSEDVTFGSTGFAFGAGMTYQWESSPDNISWSSVGGQTNPLTATITISTPAYYRLSATCSFTATTGTSNVIQIVVSSPSVLSSAGGSVCGLGTVNLTATGSGGTVLRWYDVLTGGSPLATGSPYTTPTINSTTSYYVEAVSGITNSFVGPVSPTAQGGTITLGNTGMANWRMFFEVIQTATLLSVDIFPEVAGQAGTIGIYNSAGTLLASQAYTTAVSGGATAQTITFATPPTLPVGSGYYISSIVLPTNRFTRNANGSVYPYTSSAINITSSELGATAYTYYYNWQFQTGCPSEPRTAVVATVVAPPGFTAPTASPAVVCEGASSNLTSLDADYSIYSWAPATGLSNPAIANPVATPSSTTTYTVTVSNGTCATSADVTVTVNPVPTALSITPAGPVAFCAGAAAQLLSASGGSGDLFRENFNAFPISKFTITGSGVVENQNTTYYQDAPSSVHLTHGDDADGSYEMSNSIDMTQYSNAVLTFYHIAGLEDGFDEGYVEYSTDGGTSWTPFPTSSYTGSGSLVNGVVAFEASSYPDWLSQMGTGGNPGAAPAASMWKLETINLAPWQTSTQFKVRFRIDADGSVLFYGWLIDNVRINSQATITWSPTTELFTNAAATINYTGANTNTVYTRPTASRTYTATAAFGACPVTANVDINLTSNPISLTIAAAPSTTICQGDTVDLSISAQNIQGSLNPLYDWRLNGTTITGSATGGSSVGTTVTVASTATLYPGMRVTVTAGTGAFAIDSRIVSILSPTQFTVSAVPITGLSGATITATASGRTVTTLRFGGLANGDVLTCVLAVGGVSCVPTNPVTSNSISFAVTPGVATSVSIAVSPGSTACAGENVTFTATPTNGGAAPTYEWFVNGVSQGVPSLSNTFVTTTLTTGQTVTCRMASNAINCPFPKAPFSNAIVMTINPSFPVSVSITSVPAPSGSTISICNGTSVTFTATPTNGGVTPLYEWFVNGVSQGAPSGTNTFVTTTLADLDDVTCVLTSSISSCALGNPATSNIIDVSVTTQPASVTITPAAAVCAGTSKTFTANPVNGGATPTYQWYVNSTPVGTGLATYTYTPVNGDVVEVEMSSSLSCAVPIPALGSLTQTVNALPTAGITGNNILCPGIPNLLTSNAAAGSGTITTIQWRLGGVNIGGATNTTYAATAAGNYDVVVTNSNGCTFTSPVFTITAAATPLSGTYYIGRITATNVNGAGTTLTTTSTANLVVGALLTRVTGTGTFAANTIVTSIIDATTFTINNAPSVALTGAGIGGADCDDYLSFATAIADLNTRTISANCTFNVQPGYVENISSQLILGTVALNPTVAGRTIVFQKNGVGANPLINAAFVGVSNIAGGTPDGIWSINGTDNVTIDGIDLNDNNTTNATVCMDFGYGIFKLSSTDGAQNNTITNCTITLNRVNVNAGTGVTALLPGSNGIVVLNSVRNGATAALTAGGAAGANSNNKFYSNTIQNCNTGIALSGLAAASPFTDADTGNDIGGASAATGNTIINFGGGAAAAQAAAGIVINNQWGVNASYNTINNNNGSGVNHLAVLRGIYGVASTSASATISNNTITLNGGGTTQAVTAIDNAIGSTAASNTININNNTITGSYTTATTGTFTGIANTSTAANVNMNGNTIQNITLPGTGAFIAINNGTTAVPGTLNINNNIVTGNTKTGGTIMTLIGGGNPATTAVTSISSNTVTNNTMASAATATLLGIQLAGTSTYTINGNTINNLSVTGISGTAFVTLSGISNIGGIQNETITNNTISNLFVTGTSTGNQVVRAIQNNTSGTSTRSVSLNTIFNLYTAAGLTGTVTGINSQAGGTVTIARNWIYNLFPGQSATAGSIAKGIAVSTGGATPSLGVTISNNMISLDLTLAASATGSVAANSILTGTDALRGIEITSALPNSSLFLYFNSIRLAGNGAGNFGSSGVFHTASATATTANLTMVNNLVDNEATPSGTGLTVAYRRSIGTAAALSNFNAASNNNMYYAGTPSATRLIYADGTSTAQTITAYTGGVFTAGTIAPRESASLSDIPNFISQTDLHVTAADNCALNGTGTPLAITVDYDNDARNNPPDIGADEFVGTGAFGTWAGVNTNWNDPVNWCGGVPTATTSVIIPTAPNYPDITGYTALANNITLTGSGVITVGAGGILNMRGDVTSAAGTIDITAGTLELSGTVAQTLRANHFVTATIDNLVVSNTSVGGVTIDNTGSMLFITGDVSFGNNNNQKFNTSNLLTLRSTAIKTARVADVTLNGTRTGNDVVGKVVIERYIPARRAWRLLTAPVRSATIPTPTIFSNWQEGARSFPLGTLADPVPGYGTHVSNGNNVPDFDQNNTNNSSIFYLTATGWNGVPSNTSGTTIGGNNGVITDQPGYMLFVRGNRSTNLTLGTLAPASATTLRTTGDINVTSNAAAPLVLTPGGGSPNGANFNYVFANPYPSAISFENFRNEPLNSGLTLNNTFYVWDANLTGSNGVGGWITVTRIGAGTYTTSPTGSIPGLITGQIQSGMAFMVLHTSNVAPVVRYKEAFKVSGSNISLFRPHNSQIRTTLLAKNADGTSSINDGALVYFDGVSSNSVDNEDGYKVSNFAENISILNGGIELAIEKRRSIAETDTIFLRMYRMRTKQYALSFDLAGLGTCAEGKVAILEDRYLNTKTVLDMQGNTEYNFAVTVNTPSADSGRFRIVFKKMVQFTGIRAAVAGDDVAVDWNISTELNIDRYEIERSANGTSFEAAGNQISRGNSDNGAAYSWLDVYPPSGVYYYRIKAIGKNGTVLYSDVAKVTIIKRSPAIFVFPNPVTNNVIGLQLTKMPAGMYEAALFSSDGKVISRSRFVHAGGTATEKITPRYLLPGGNYRVEITGPDKAKTVISIMVQKQ